MGGINQEKTKIFAAVSACRPFYPQVFWGISPCLPPSLVAFVCGYVCMCLLIQTLLKVHRGNIICFSNHQTDANLLAASIPCVCTSLRLFASLSFSLCLPQSIQLYVAEMLEVPGEPSLVPAIQTATLHLSTVPGLLKSATGKARDAHRFTLLNRDRQSERQQQVTQTSVVQPLV